jgi:hypothetical protein
MSAPDTSTTGDFDYGKSAVVFSLRLSHSRRQPLDYRRFTSAAEALSFVVQDLPPQFFVGAYLQVEESRYQGAEIRRLYARHYPLPRRVAAGPIA